MCVSCVVFVLHLSRYRNTDDDVRKGGSWGDGQESDVKLAKEVLPGTFIVPV